jgi:photosystem II stability/assembly factor-like uncharacterized protein
MIKVTKKLLPSLLFLTLLAAIIPYHHPVSAVDAAQWTPVNLPIEGIPGKWTLANGSDIRYLTMSNDGTLYCYANPAGTTSTLFKSADNGRSWTTTGKVADVITDIAALPQDSKNIYYATASRVYKSVDAGNTFIALPPNPGGAGSGNVLITSLDVVRLDNADIIAVSTIDTDTAQYGGVYLLDESQGMSAWVNTGIGNYDVYRVAFSPDYTNDRQLIAITSDEADTFIISKINTMNWGQWISKARIHGIVPSAAGIAFPDNYNGITGNASFLIGIATGSGNGDVYQVNCALTPAPSTAKDLHIGAIDGLDAVDIAGLATAGNTIIAGCAGNAGVYLSNDNGVSWTPCNKPPTGQTDTCVLMAPDFAALHRAYAVTGGVESAFSYSIDGGLTWNQVSLIDTGISEISDIAAPLAATTFMLTFNSSDLIHSLWRTTDSGSTWERIFCGSYPGIDNLDLVKAVPQYSTDTPVILLTGQQNNYPVIWKSTDNGRNFTLRAAPCAIDILTIIDSNTWFVGGYDGSSGLVYETINGGNFYTDPVEAGSQPLTNLVLSPDYAQDKTVLAGNSVGQVYLSQDNGKNFSLPGQQLPLTAGLGRISPAFDSKFSENKIIYAATDAAVTSTGKERIFRFTIGKSTAWQSISVSLPNNAVIKQLVIAQDGTLYAVNTQAIVAADKKGGVIRSLDPASSSPAIETMLSGLDDTITLNKLSVYGNRLWTVDTKNTRLMTFLDSLALPVALISPDNNAAGLDITNLSLKWQPVNGATGYEWQVSDNTSFTGLLTGLTGTAESGSARPIGLEPAATYYWRIRTSKPFLSRWSDTWSFNTVLGGSNIVPSLSVPAAGAKTGVKPVFQWTTIASAAKYDLLVAIDNAFNEVVIDRTGDNALSSNAWESDINLENDTTYYWKVKARSDKSVGTWSAVGVFTTESVLPTTAAAEAPQSTTDPPPQPTLIVSTVLVDSPNTQPSVNVNINIPQWVIYGGGALLAVIVITLAALVVTSIIRRH